MSEQASAVPGGADGTADVHCLEISGRTVILVGTAHISQDSVDLVREVIEREKPDRVCVELDEKRFQSLAQQTRWESLDLRQLIKDKQLTTLLANLVLASYQKRLGSKLGVMPGSELKAAVETAQELGIPVSLCDRDIRVTLRRAWGRLGLFRKLMLLSSLLATLFEREELTEEQLREMRRHDVLSELMAELGAAFPGLKQVLIDERDDFLADAIRAAEGNKLVAVVGAGHVQGMLKALETSRPVDREALSEIPPVSPVWPIVGWSIPAIILGSIGWIGYTKGAVAAGANASYWFFANAILSGLGAAVALGHPGTVVIAALAAPFTSLTPLIGAGYVAAFVQAWLKPPLVREFQSVGDDLTRMRAWWQSRLLRVFLVFGLTSIGSMVGSWMGGIKIVRELF